MHVAIRHGHTKFMIRIIELFDKNPIYMNGKGQGAFDIFNGQEKCTPFTLAVLRENFELSEILHQKARSDRFIKNADNENVFDIAKRLNIKPVQKFLVKF
jgi:hypothetical protein